MNLFETVKSAVTAVSYTHLLGTEIWLPTDDVHY